ncbi:MAG: hypothetical protein GX923_01550 [Clostridia bacterium]|jgi:hypothetical protein|nr:hypothetical protein [Clostridia bacterium]
MGCNKSSQTVQGEYEKQIQDFIRERIQNYSTKHFSKLEECEVSFYSEDKVKVYIKFIPDFGSIIFKNEIWHWSALHALNLSYLFPEIKEYHYSVFDTNNNKLMDLYLDEGGIRMLPDKFYGQKGPGNYYRFCFTNVEETTIGKELPIDENFFEGSGLP